MKGVLLLNLGSPDSPSVQDVRRYLREFLMDGRVLDVSWPVRFCIVNFAILPSRPRQSAHAYQAIWTPAGSPLVVTSRNVQAKLRQRVSVPVELSMRYQNPSIPEAVGRLAEKGVTDLLLVPLFPHYAMSSFETAVERVKEVIAELAPQMQLTVQPPCYDAPDYITALVASAADFLSKPFDHLLFSFHGLPERQLRKSDPTGCHCLTAANCCESPSPAHATCYRAQCFKTVAAFVKQAGLPQNKYSVSFQSRLGRDPWLKPYTDFELPRLAQAGVKKMLVICPAFVSDCLETLEEIGMRGRETFLEAGGTDFALIPCLNEHPLWLDALENMVKRFVQPQTNQPAGRPMAAQVN
ncbi:MAG TPA: ferrochelatase [Candidatus Dormibacteraeota bacterium]|nr:ferrochelatase [Candidatus Dormibacteraeota bacterium]